MFKAVQVTGFGSEADAIFQFVQFTHSLLKQRQRLQSTTYVTHPLKKWYPLIQNYRLGLAMLETLDGGFTDSLSNVLSSFSLLISCVRKSKRFFSEVDSFLCKKTLATVLHICKLHNIFCKLNAIRLGFF